MPAVATYAQRGFGAFDRLRMAQKMRTLGDPDPLRREKSAQILGVKLPEQQAQEQQAAIDNRAAENEQKAGLAAVRDQQREVARQQRAQTTQQPKVAKPPSKTAQEAADRAARAPVLDELKFQGHENAQKLRDVQAEEARVKADTQKAQAAAVQHAMQQPEAKKMFHPGPEINLALNDSISTYSQVQQKQKEVMAQKAEERRNLAAAESKRILDTARVRAGKPLTDAAAAKPAEAPVIQAAPMVPASPADAGEDVRNSGDQAGGVRPDKGQRFPSKPVRPPKSDATPEEVKAYYGGVPPDLVPGAAKANVPADAATVVEPPADVAPAIPLADRQAAHQSDLQSLQAKQAAASAPINAARDAFTRENGEDPIVVQPDGTWGRAGKVTEPQWLALRQAMEFQNKNSPPQDELDAINAQAKALNAEQDQEAEKQRAEVQKQREALPPDVREALNANDRGFRDAHAQIAEQIPEGPARDAAAAALDAKHQEQHQAIIDAVPTPQKQISKVQKEQAIADDVAAAQSHTEDQGADSYFSMQAGHDVAAERLQGIAEKHGVSADELTKAKAAADARPYSVDEKGGLMFARHSAEGLPTPEEALAGFTQAEKDGLLDPEGAKEGRKQLEEAKAKYDELVKVASKGVGGAVTSGDAAAKVNAVLRGAGRGGAFLAASVPGAVGFGAAGGKLGALAGPQTSAVLAAIGATFGGLATGTAGAWSYDKVMEKLGDYSETIRALNAAAVPNKELGEMGFAGPDHAGYAQAGELSTFLLAPEAFLKPSVLAKEGVKAGFTPAVVKSIQNYAKAAKIAADGVGEKGISAALDAQRSIAAANSVLQNLGGAATGGALFTAAMPVFDAGRYFLADRFKIKHDEFRAPGLQDLAFNVGLGLLLHGRGLTFKDYSASGMTSVMMRGKVREENGIDLHDGRIDPKELLKLYEDAGFDVDRWDAKLKADLTRPLTSEEAAMRTAAMEKVQVMQQSGQLPTGTGVDFEGGRQAIIPGLFGKNTPISSAAIKPRAATATRGSGLPESPPSPVEHAMKEAKSAASEAELASYARQSLAIPTQDVDAAIARARVARDIAQGKPLSDLTNSELSAVGLQRDQKGEIKPAKGGKDAPPPAVTVENGQPIILQPAIDEIRQQFPATGALIGMDEVEARKKLSQPSAPPTSQLKALDTVRRLRATGLSPDEIIAHPDYIAAKAHDEQILSQVPEASTLKPGAPAQAQTQQGDGGASPNAGADVAVSTKGKAQGAVGASPAEAAPVSAISDPNHQLMVAEGRKRKAAGDTDGVARAVSRILEKMAEEDPAELKAMIPDMTDAEAAEQASRNKAANAERRAIIDELQSPIPAPKAPSDMTREEYATYLAEHPEASESKGQHGFYAELTKRPELRGKKSVSPTKEQQDEIYGRMAPIAEALGIPGNLNEPWMQVEIGDHKTKNQDGSRSKLYVTFKDWTNSWTPGKMAAFKNLLARRGYNGSFKTKGRAPFNADKVLSSFDDVVAHAKSDSDIAIARRAAEEIWGAEATYQTGLDATNPNTGEHTSHTDLLASAVAEAVAKKRPIVLPRNAYKAPPPSNVPHGTPESIAVKFRDYDKHGFLAREVEMPHEEAIKVLQKRRNILELLKRCVGGAAA